MQPTRVLILPLLAIAACSHGHDPVTVTPRSRPVSIQVEVYDPATNFVWENVGVRIVEADQEWSACTCRSPFDDFWFFTDRDGLVFLDEFTIADAEVGFREDGRGAAVIGPRSFEDEATVVLLVDALGFTPVVVEVPLSWDQPDVFVSVPFN